MKTIPGTCRIHCSSLEPGSVWTRAHALWMDPPRLPILFRPAPHVQRRLRPMPRHRTHRLPMPPPPPHPLIQRAHLPIRKLPPVPTHTVGRLQTRPLQSPIHVLPQPTLPRPVPTRMHPRRHAGVRRQMSRTRKPPHIPHFQRDHHGSNPPYPRQGHPPLHRRRHFDPSLHPRLHLVHLRAHKLVRPQQLLPHPSSARR